MQPPEVPESGKLEKLLAPPIDKWEVTVSVIPHPCEGNPEELNHCCRTCLPNRSTTEPSKKDLHLPEPFPSS
ncbi:hypothetical protein J6590_078704 [Homalodisca vitripennis]|nr:hypothetical protein J6590_078704 [Homalodisca vitripennis]